MSADRTRRSSGGPGAEGPEWLTLGGAAGYLGVAQSTVRKWSDTGELTVFTTPGGHRRFRRRDLDAFLEHARAPHGRRPSVLVVDDDPGVRAVVRESLELEGFLVREAGSAQDGLDELERELADIILLDLMMPGVDGLEMLRRVQERHGVGAVPVIMFSSRVEADAAAAGELGVQQFVGKPFDPYQLVEAAKKLLHG